MSRYPLFFSEDVERTVLCVVAARLLLLVITNVGDLTASGGYSSPCAGPACCTAANMLGQRLPQLWVLATPARSKCTTEIVWSQRVSAIVGWHNFWVHANQSCHLIILGKMCVPFWLKHLTKCRVREVLPSFRGTGLCSCFCLNKAKKYFLCPRYVAQS